VKSSVRGSDGSRSLPPTSRPDLLAWQDGDEVSETRPHEMRYRAEPEGVLAVVEVQRSELCRSDGTLNSRP